MSNNMSIIVRCGCGNIVDLKSDRNGHQIQLRSTLIDSDFRLDSPDVELDGELEEIEDLDDIDVSLGSIRINCNKCGDYIVIEDYY